MSQQNYNINRVSLRFGFKVAFAASEEEHARAGLHLRATNNMLHPVGIPAEPKKPGEIERNFENAVFQILSGYGNCDNDVLRRRFGEEITYGQTVRLLHISSKTLLCVHRHSRANAERQHHKVTLEHFSSSEIKSSKWRILPSFKIRSEGQRILNGDGIVLQSLSGGADVFLNVAKSTAINAASLSSSSSGGGHEVTAHSGGVDQSIAYGQMLPVGTAPPDPARTSSSSSSSATATSAATAAAGGGGENTSFTQQNKKGKEETTTTSSSGEGQVSTVATGEIHYIEVNAAPHPHSSRFYILFYDIEALPVDSHDFNLRCGDCIQLFHREHNALLSSEIMDEKPFLEQVGSDPEAEGQNANDEGRQFVDPEMIGASEGMTSTHSSKVYPSTSLFVIEQENVCCGGPVRMGRVQFYRLKNLSTGLYLAMRVKKDVAALEKAYSSAMSSSPSSTSPAAKKSGGTSLFDFDSGGGGDNNNNNSKNLNSTSPSNNNKNAWNRLGLKIDIPGGGSADPPASAVAAAASAAASGGGNNTNNNNSNSLFNSTWNNSLGRTSGDVFNPESPLAAEGNHIIYARPVDSFEVFMSNDPDDSNCKLCFHQASDDSSLYAKHHSRCFIEFPLLDTHGLFLGSELTAETLGGASPLGADLTPQSSGKDYLAAGFNGAGGDGNSNNASAVFAPLGGQTSGANWGNGSSSSFSSFLAPAKRIRLNTHEGVPRRDGVEIRKTPYREFQELNSVVQLMPPCLNLRSALEKIIEKHAEFRLHANSFTDFYNASSPLLPGEKDNSISSSSPASPTTTSVSERQRMKKKKEREQQSKDALLIRVLPIHLVRHTQDNLATMINMCTPASLERNPLHREGAPDENAQQRLVDQRVVFYVMDIIELLARVGGFEPTEDGKGIQTSEELLATFTAERKPEGGVGVGGAGAGGGGGEGGSGMLRADSQNPGGSSDGGFSLGALGSGTSTAILGSLAGGGNSSGGEGLIGGEEGGFQSHLSHGDFLHVSPSAGGHLGLSEAELAEHHHHDDDNNNTNLPHVTTEKNDNLIGGMGTYQEDGTVLPTLTTLMTGSPPASPGEDNTTTTTTTTNATSLMPSALGGGGGGGKRKKTVGFGSDVVSNNNDDQQDGDGSGAGGGEGEEHSEYEGKKVRHTPHRVPIASSLSFMGNSNSVTAAAARAAGGSRSPTSGMTRDQQIIARKRLVDQIRQLIYNVIQLGFRLIRMVAIGNETTSVQMAPNLIPRILKYCSHPKQKIGATDALVEIYRDHRQLADSSDDRQETLQAVLGLVKKHVRDACQSLQLLTTLTYSDSRAIVKAQNKIGVQLLASGLLNLPDGHPAEEKWKYVLQSASHDVEKLENDFKELYPFYKLGGWLVTGIDSSGGSFLNDENEHEDDDAIFNHNDNNNNKKPTFSPASSSSSPTSTSAATAAAAAGGGGTTTQGEGEKIFSPSGEAVIVDKNHGNSNNQDGEGNNNNNNNSNSNSASAKRLRKQQRAKAVPVLFRLWLGEGEQAGEILIDVDHDLIPEAFRLERLSRRASGIYGRGDNDYHHHSHSHHHPHSHHHDDDSDHNNHHDSAPHHLTPVDGGMKNNSSDKKLLAFGINMREESGAFSSAAAPAGSANNNRDLYQLHQQRHNSNASGSSIALNLNLEDESPVTLDEFFLYFDDFDSKKHNLAGSASGSSSGGSAFGDSSSRASSSAYSGETEGEVHVKKKLLSKQISPAACLLMQLRLVAALCADRHEENIKIVQALYPWPLLLRICTAKQEFSANDKLLYPGEVRAAVFNIIQHAYVNVKPLPDLIANAENPVYLWEDVVKENNEKRKELGWLTSERDIKKDVTFDPEDNNPKLLSEMEKKQLNIYVSGPVGKGIKKLCAELKEYIKRNGRMDITWREENACIEAALSLAKAFIRYGWIETSEYNSWLQQIAPLLDGRDDLGPRSHRMPNSREFDAQAGLFGFAAAENSPLGAAGLAAAAAGGGGSGGSPSSPSSSSSSPTAASEKQKPIWNRYIYDDQNHIIMSVKMLCIDCISMIATIIRTGIIQVMVRAFEFGKPPPHLCAILDLRPQSKIHQRSLDMEIKRSKINQYRKEREEKAEQQRRSGAPSASLCDALLGLGSSAIDAVAELQNVLTSSDDRADYEYLEFLFEVLLDNCCYRYDPLVRRSLTLYLELSNMHYAMMPSLRQLQLLTDRSNQSFYYEVRKIAVDLRRYFHSAFSAHDVKHIKKHILRLYDKFHSTQLYEKRGTEEAERIATERYSIFQHMDFHTMVADIVCKVAKNIPQNFGGGFGGQSAFGGGDLFSGMSAANFGIPSGGGSPVGGVFGSGSGGSGGGGIGVASVSNLEITVCYGSTFLSNFLDVEKLSAKLAGDLAKFIEPFTYLLASFPAVFCPILRKIFSLHFDVCRNVSTESIENLVSAVVAWKTNPQLAHLLRLLVFQATAADQGDGLIVRNQRVQNKIIDVLQHNPELQGPESILREKNFFTRKHGLNRVNLFLAPNSEQHLEDESEIMTRLELITGLIMCVRGRSGEQRTAARHILFGPHVVSTLDSIHHLLDKNPIVGVPFCSVFNELFLQDKSILGILCESKEILVKVLNKFCTVLTEFANTCREINRGDDSGLESGLFWENSNPSASGFGTSQASLGHFGPSQSSGTFGGSGGSGKLAQQQQVQQQVNQARLSVLAKGGSKFKRVDAIPSEIAQAANQDELAEAAAEAESKAVAKNSSPAASPSPAPLSPAAVPSTTTTVSSSAFDAAAGMGDQTSTEAFFNEENKNSSSPPPSTSAAADTLKQAESSSHVQQQSPNKKLQQQQQESKEQQEEEEADEALVEMTKASRNAMKNSFETSCYHTLLCVVPMITTLVKSLVIDREEREGEVFGRLQSLIETAHDIVDQVFETYPLKKVILKKDGTHQVIPIAKKVVDNSDFGMLGSFSPVRRTSISGSPAAAAAAGGAAAVEGEGNSPLRRDNNNNNDPGFEEKDGEFSKLITVEGDGNSNQASPTSAASSSSHHRHQQHNSRRESVLSHKSDSHSRNSPNPNNNNSNSEKADQQQKQPEQQEGNKYRESPLPPEREQSVLRERQEEEEQRQKQRQQQQQEEEKIEMYLAGDGVAEDLRMPSSFFFLETPMVDQCPAVSGPDQMPLVCLRELASLLEKGQQAFMVHDPTETKAKITKLRLIRNAEDADLQLSLEDKKKQEKEDREREKKLENELAEIEKRKDQNQLGGGGGGGGNNDAASQGDSEFGALAGAKDFASATTFASFSSPLLSSHGSGGGFKEKRSKQKTKQDQFSEWIDLFESTSYGTSEKTMFRTPARLALRRGRLGHQMIMSVVKTLESSHVSQHDRCMFLAFLRQVLVVNNEDYCDAALVLPDVMDDYKNEPDPAIRAQMKKKLLSIDKTQKERQNIMAAWRGGALLPPKLVRLVNTYNSKITKASLLCGIALLSEGCLSMQQSLMDYFLSTNRETFFAVCRTYLGRAKDSVLEREHLIKDETADRNLQEPNQDVIDEIGASFEKDFTLVTLLLRFVQLMCEGHYRPCQEYLRVQEDNQVSISVLEPIMVLFETLVNVEHGLDSGVFALTIQVMNTIIESCQGPCAANQRAFISNNAGGVVTRLFSFNHKFLEKAQLYSVCRSGMMLILALLEGHTNTTLISMLMHSITLSVLVQRMDETFFEWDNENGRKSKHRRRWERDRKREEQQQRILEASAAASAAGGGNVEGGVVVTGNAGEEEEEDYENDMHIFGAENPISHYCSNVYDDLLEFFQSLFNPPKLKNEFADKLNLATSIYIFLKTVLDIENLKMTSLQLDTSDEHNLQFKDRNGENLVRAFRKSHSFSDLSQIVATIEILRNGKVERCYFRVPETCRNLQEESKQKLIDEVTRTGDGARLQFFFERCTHLMNELDFYDEMRRTRGLALIYLYAPMVETAGLLIAFALNILMIAYTEFHYADNNMAQVPAGGPELTFFVLSIILCALQSWLFLNFWFSELKSEIQQQWLNWEDDLNQKEKYKSRQSLSIIPANLKTGKDKWSDSLRIYEVWYWNCYFALGYAPLYKYAIFCALAYLGFFFSPIWFAFQPLQVIWKNPQLYNVVEAILINRYTLALTFVLLLVTINVFAVIAYFFFSDMFDDDMTGTGGNCETMLRCFVTSLIMGLKFGGGISEVTRTEPYTLPNPVRFFTRQIYDFLFFIVLIILFLNLVFGIILDTFSSLRQEREATDDDQESKCFICGIGRDTLDKHVVGGFTSHVIFEHKMWCYCFFMKYLSMQSESDFTGIEGYVADAVKRKEITWFPIGRSLAVDFATGRGQAGEESKDVEHDGWNADAYQQKQHELQQQHKMQQQYNAAAAASSLTGTVTSGGGLSFASPTNNNNNTMRRNSGGGGGGGNNLSNSGYLQQQQPSASAAATAAAGGGGNDGGNFPQQFSSSEADVMEMARNASSLLVSTESNNERLARVEASNRELKDQLSRMEKLLGALVEKK